MGSSWRRSLGIALSVPQQDNSSDENEAVLQYYAKPFQKEYLCLDRFVYFVKRLQRNSSQFHGGMEGAVRLSASASTPRTDTPVLWRRASARILVLSWALDKE